MPTVDPCSQLAKTITELAMNIGARPEVKNLDDVVKHMQELVPQIDRTTLVASINEATTGYAKAREELAKKLDRLKREARNDTKLRDAVRQMEGHISGGTQPTPQKRPTTSTPKAIADLRAERDRLAGILDMRDPAKRQAVRDRITELDAHIKMGTMPPRAPSKEVPLDLANLRRIRDEKLRQVRMADPAKRSAIRKEIADLSGAIRKGQYVAREPAKTTATPADLQKLRAERDRLRAQVEKFNPDRVAEWQARVSTLEDHLNRGTLPESSPGSPEANPRVAELKDRRDELMAALRRSDAAIKKRYLTDIENLTDRLENGVFTLPEPKVKRPLNQELDAIQYKRDKLRDEIRAHTESLKPKTIFDLAAAPLSDARAVMTAYDVSAVLRQGGFVALGNPVRAAKALPDMFRSLASGEKAYHINKAIFERENAPLYHRAGLFLSETGHSDLGRQEELFVSRWAKLLPGVKASERAYVAFLNKIRADTFDSMAASLAKDGNPTIAEMEAIANFVNVATGRGKLHGSLEKASDALNKTLFAPRYVASRFQLLAGQPIYGGSAATRKLIIREYAKFITGAGVVLGLGAMAGGEVELDPRSSDFGKLRFGETRLDPFGGLTQVVTFASRLATGKFKNSKGELESAYGDGARQDASTTIGRFLRSKLAPFPGAVLDSLSGQNIVGEPTTPVDAAIRMVTPMSVRDIYEAVKEQGVPAGTAMSLISLLGVSMNTYGPRAKSRAIMAELEDSGLQTSSVYKQMQSLGEEYDDATKERRSKIQEHLERLNSQARKMLKSKRGG